MKLAHQITPPPVDGTDAANKDYADASGGGGATPDNVLPVDQGDVDNAVYCRTTGNDTTGDGSIGNPFLTPQRGADELLRWSRGQNNILDLTDLGVVNVGSGLELPQIHSSDDGALDFAGTSVDFFKAPLTIRAQMTVEDTITGGEVVSQTPAAVTGFRTVATTKSFTPGALVGKFLVSESFLFGVPIVSNTATDIVIPANFDLGAPLTIQSPSCTLRSTSRAAIVGRHVPCRVELAGLRLENTAGGFNPGIDLLNCGLVNLNLCVVDGANLTESKVNLLSCYGDGNTIFLQQLVEANVANCFFNGTDIDMRSVSGPNFWQSVYFDGCDPFGNSGTITDFYTVALECDRIHIANSTSSGIRVRNNSAMRIVRAVIEGSAGDGILIERGARARLIDVHGGSAANAGYGLYVRHGSQVQVDALSDITGTTGELKAGANAAITWAAFHPTPPNNEVDATTELARIYEL